MELCERVDLAGDAEEEETAPMYMYIYYDKNKYTIYILNYEDESVDV